MNGSKSENTECTFSRKSLGYSWSSEDHSKRLVISHKGSLQLTWAESKLGGVFQRPLQSTICVVQRKNNIQFTIPRQFSYNDKMNNAQALGAAFQIMQKGVSKNSGLRRVGVLSLFKHTYSDKIVWKVLACEMKNSFLLDSWAKLTPGATRGSAGAPRERAGSERLAKASPSWLIRTDTICFPSQVDNLPGCRVYYEEKTHPSYLLQSKVIPVRTEDCCLDLGDFKGLEFRLLSGLGWLLGLYPKKWGRSEASKSQNKRPRGLSTSERNQETPNNHVVMHI